MTQVTCFGRHYRHSQRYSAHTTRKLHDINQVVRHWLDKDVASKRQLQSVLGLLLYVHKCVTHEDVVLNRMLDLFRSSHGHQNILLTPEFKRDLR